MDRNTLIGILLIVGIFLTWSIVTNTQKPEKHPASQDSLVTSVLPDTGQKADIKTAASALPDSLPDSVKSQYESLKQMERYGDFAPAASGEEKFITLTTEKLKVKFSTHGGKIVALSLNPKDYVSYDSSRLFIQDERADNDFSVLFSMRGTNQVVVNSSELYFQPQFQSDSLTLKGNEKAEIAFRASAGEGKYLELKYTFHASGNDYDFKVNFVGLDDRLKDKAYELIWVNNLPVTEKSVGEIRKKSTIFYSEGDNVSSLNMTRTTQEMYQAKQGKLDFISFNSQFFAHTLLASPSKPFNSFDVIMNTPVTNDYVKRMEARVRIERDTTSLKFYAGPLEYYTLKSYDRKMEKMLNLGWGPLKWINAYVIIPIFKLLENTIGNYGWIILILALLIKLVTLPFTHRTFISMAKMRIANSTPEMKALEEKYKDDQVKLSQEKMGLYRKLGASPFGGCVPMILQYPILISMFFFFPQSIELRQQAFLWAEDLSTYDSIWDFGYVPIVNSIYGDHVSLWTVLMTISIFIYTWVNQKAQGSNAMNQAPGMKYFPYIMPFMLLGFLNNYSAGLSYYYFLSNILSIGQNQLTKYFVDDQKILAQLREFEKKKGASTSNKKGWLERMAEANEKRQREMTEARRKKK